MQQVCTKPMTRVDLFSNLLLPLPYKCNRTDDKSRLLQINHHLSKSKCIYKHTLRARSEDGRLKINAREEMVFPKPISSARMPPLLVPSSIAFSQLKAIFWCSYFKPVSYLVVLLLLRFKNSLGGTSCHLEFPLFLQEVDQGQV
jgi:hypothetical protein